MTEKSAVGQKNVVFWISLFYAGHQFHFETAKKICNSLAAGVRLSGVEFVLFACRPIHLYSDSASCWLVDRVSGQNVQCIKATDCEKVYQDGPAEASETFTTGGLTTAQKISSSSPKSFPI